MIAPADDAVFNPKAFLRDELCVEKGCGHEAHYYCEFCGSFLCIRHARVHKAEDAKVIRLE